MLLMEITVVSIVSVNSKKRLTTINDYIMFETKIELFINRYNIHNSTHCLYLFKN